jgi:heme/copper-type cytochrome/quinol oxidase subunit 3
MADDATELAAFAGGHPQASYGETEESIHQRQRTGVLYFLAADGVFVACIIFTYFYLRGLNTDGGWLPKGVSPAGAHGPWLVAAIMLISAACYQVGRRGGRAGNRGALRIGVGLALLLVLVDLVVQILQVVRLSFSTTSGAYASSYYIMAGYHMFHLIVLGLIGLGLFTRAVKGLYDEPGRRNELDLVGLAFTWTAIAASLFAVALLFTGAPHA